MSVLSSLIALSLTAPLGGTVPFSYIAAQGPWLIEIDHLAHHVSKLIGKPAKKRRFVDPEGGYPELAGHLAILYDFPEGWVTVLFDKNQSARFVAIHAVPSKKFSPTFNKGGNPSFALNKPIPKGVFSKLYSHKDIKKLPQLKESYSDLEDGQVIAGEANWGASILYVDYFGRIGNYCQMILRQDPYSSTLQGYGYFEKLSPAEIRYAVDHMFFPPDRLW